MLYGVSCNIVKRSPTDHPCGNRLVYDNDDDDDAVVAAAGVAAAAQRVLQVLLARTRAPSSVSQSRANSCFAGLRRLHWHFRRSFVRHPNYHLLITVRTKPVIRSLNNQIVDVNNYRFRSVSRVPSCKMSALKIRDPMYRRERRRWPRTPDTQLSDDSMDDCQPIAVHTTEVIVHRDAVDAPVTSGNGDCGTLVPPPPPYVRHLVRKLKAPAAVTSTTAHAAAATVDTYATKESTAAIEETITATEETTAATEGPTTATEKTTTATEKGSPSDKDMELVEMQPLLSSSHKDKDIVAVSENQDVATGTTTACATAPAIKSAEDTTTEAAAPGPQDYTCGEECMFFSMDFCGCTIM